jgi:hypothetical protein
MKHPIRQGDVLIKPIQVVKGEPLSHLVLAEGEVTGHKHQITEGVAELYQQELTLYLRVVSDTAILSHEEHGPVQIPQGDWAIHIQREYEPSGWRFVAD